MFAILSAISFAIALFHGHMGDINFVTLGLLFLALHLIRPIWPTKG